MKVLVGNLLESNAQTLVNTVNCVGVMGKGIALEFKKQFPDMFKDYVARCKRGEVRPGIPYLYRSLLGEPQIVNFPTKDHWKSVSRLADIERGLQYLLDHYRQWEITSIAIPPLGCGNGQLEWSAVGPLIYRYAQRLDIPVELYAPYGTPSRELTHEFLEQHRPASQKQIPTNGSSGKASPAWVALVEIVRRLESQPYHWPIGRTIFQKIAFLATRQGLPTGLEYARGSFGPFSGGLKRVQTVLVNSNLLQETRRGPMFEVSSGPNYERVRKNYAEHLDEWAGIIDKTVDLFSRMDTRQAEIVATVIFAFDGLRRDTRAETTEMDVFRETLTWKQKRKPPLNEEEVASAIRNLAMLRWLDVRYSSELPVPAEEEFLTTG